MSNGGKYRSRAIADSVIAFSLSSDAANLLARGMGIDHLREMLLRMARPFLRSGASLAYGGSWKETEDNFTYDLLRLVSAEQEDNSIGGPNSGLQIGTLYSHSSWPYYLEITPRIEAQWINSCRIIRVSQELAGFAAEDVVGDVNHPKAKFNTAVCLSVMRHRMMKETFIAFPDISRSERIPPVVARVLLGGKLAAYSGFMPGVFEEALVTMEHDRPLYILGGFGGAAEMLARAIMSSSDCMPAELTMAWHTERLPNLCELLASVGQPGSPIGFNPPSFDKLADFVQQARLNPASTLKTGLSDEQTRELLMTHNMDTAVKLVRQGLQEQRKLPTLAS